MIKKYYKNKPIPLKFFLENQRGIAVVEMLPLLSVFIILFGLTFGFWTSIHHGTLSSIAARHYAFEVINNRTHFIYHRDTMPAQDKRQYYGKDGHRFFAVVKTQQVSRLQLKAIEKELNLFNGDPIGIPRVVRPNQSQASPIGIEVGYGICIDFDCGGR